MSGDDCLEIERKFLVTELPEEAARLRATPILQGYLMQDDRREIRLRRAGPRCFLTAKDGAGLARREVEIGISVDQFQSLWPLTEGRRLEKTRLALPHGNLTLEIDRYGGDLAPLCVAEVEFPSLAESKRFEPPSFFGREITGKSEYANASLALHGRPHPAKTSYRIGVLPYLFRGDRLHIVLITNSSQTRWLIPKGQPEPGMSRPEVGILECFEEAGAIGSLSPGLHAQCRLKDGTALHVYPLKVSTLLAKWPESGSRRRLVVPHPEAIRTISDRHLALCVDRLAAKLTA